MAHLNLDTLEELVRVSEGPCVSLYLPTHRDRSGARQDPIRLKNLLREAEEQLAKLDTGADVGSLLAPAREKLEDTLYWSYQSDGLAVFLSPGLGRLHRLPLAFPEVVVVADRFHLKPLLPLLSGDGRFYVLALSQQRTRLLEATRFHVRELEPRGLPQGLEAAVGAEAAGRTLQFHTGTASHGGDRRRAMYHGHGAGVDDLKPELLKYFRQVDEKVLETVADRRAPLVLAAVDYLLPLYREASRHPVLLEDGVEGNPDTANPAELREKAWKLVEPRFRADQEQAVARYRELVGTGRAEGDLEAVVPLAMDGRVDTLIVPLGVQRWGRFDAETRRVELHENRRPGDEDLLDLAAFQCLLSGSRVFAVPPDEVPNGDLLAAILRY